MKTIKQIIDDIQKFSPHPKLVKILAVSKKQPIDKIQNLLNQNHFQFGENYVQEALDKMQKLPKTIEWHLIGHLQSKKVNSVIGKFAFIHSIDSLKVAELISEKSATKGIVQNIFIEVNIGDEESKNGFTVQQLKEQWLKVVSLDSLRIYGLMTLPPPSDDIEVTRAYFKELKNLQSQLKTSLDSQRHPFADLSMGTSQDYIAALQEGSTIIRIGTTLFGERV